MQIRGHKLPHPMIGVVVKGVISITELRKIEIIFAKICGTPIIFGKQVFNSNK